MNSRFITSRPGLRGEGVIEEDMPNRPHHRERIYSDLYTVKRIWWMISELTMISQSSGVIQLLIWVHHVQANLYLHFFQRL